MRHQVRQLCSVDCHLAVTIEWVHAHQQLGQSELMFSTIIALISVSSSRRQYTLGICIFCKHWGFAHSVHLLSEV